jgi:predicted kinase
MKKISFCASIRGILFIYINWIFVHAFLESSEMSQIQNFSTGAIPRTTNRSNYVPSNYNSTIEIINKGLRVCVVMRGCPGSGKSFLAKKIIADTVVNNEDNHILSTDNFFMKNGRYEFDGSKLSEAHYETQKNFIKRCSAGVSPLVVDNTNMEYWEMSPYFQAAIQYEYHIEIMEPCTPWKWSESKLAQNNKHNVPLESIRRMKAKYQTGVNLKDLLRHSLNLDLVEEPKMRNIPPVNPTHTNPIPNQLVDVPLQNEELNTIDNIGSSLFQWNIPEKSLNQIIALGEPKKTEKTGNDLITLDWNPPPRIFEDNWELPDQKEIAIKEKPKEKDKNDDPLPQRKVRKNKKSSSPPSSSESEFSPHRKDCMNENINFAQLRELYPNINDKYIWDLFIHCKGDADWCANLLCDENKMDIMDAGNELNCDCGNPGKSNAPEMAAQTKKPKENGKKQTPVKSKKMKTDDKNLIELNALKIALEENVRIGKQINLKKKY